MLFSKPPLLNSNHKMRLPPRFLSQLAVLSYQSSLLKCRSVSEVRGVYFQTGIMIRVILRELRLGMCLHKGARCQKKATQAATGHEEGLFETGQYGTLPAQSTRSFLHVLDPPGCSNFFWHQVILALVTDIHKPCSHICVLPPKRTNAPDLYTYRIHPSVSARLD